MSGKIEITVELSICAVGVLLQIACYYDYLATDFFYLGILLVFAAVVAALSGGEKFLVPIIVATLISAVNYFLLAPTIDSARYEQVVETGKMIGIAIAVAIILALIVRGLEHETNG